MKTIFDIEPVDLAKIIMKDSELTNKVIKLANSAYIGRWSKVREVPQAIVVLGINTVVNLTFQNSERV